jgi:hypothetical protein
MEIIEYFVMDYNELDELVRKNVPNAPKDWEFCAIEESSNGVCYSFDVSEKWLSKDWIKREVKEVEDGKTFYPSYVLTYLVSKKILKPGNYLIKVSW